MSDKITHSEYLEVLLRRRIGARSVLHDARYSVEIQEQRARRALIEINHVNRALYASGYTGDEVQDDD